MVNFISLELGLKIFGSIQIDNFVLSLLGLYFDFCLFKHADLLVDIVVD